MRTVRLRSEKVWSYNTLYLLEVIEFFARTKKFFFTYYFVKKENMYDVLALKVCGWFNLISPYAWRGEWALPLFFRTGCFLRRKLSKKGIRCGSILLFFTTQRERERTENLIKNFSVLSVFILVAIWFFSYFFSYQSSV